VELVEVAANPDSDDTATMQAFATKMLEHLEGRRLPRRCSSGSRKEPCLYPPGSRKCARAAATQTRLRGQVSAGAAFIVQEESPEAAAAVLKSLRDGFEGATTAKVGDEAFQATAKYLGGVCIFRKGKTIAGYANLPEPQDASTRLSGSLLGFRKRAYARRRHFAHEACP